MSNIQESLRKLRAKHGFSREQLAAKSGVSYPYLAGLETKENTNPSLDILEKLADAFEIPMDELIGRKIPKSKK